MLPRQQHRRGHLGDNADHPAAGHRVPEPSADAGQQRAVAEWDQNGVDRRAAAGEVAGHFKRDRARAFGDLTMGAVLDVEVAVLRGEGSGGILCSIEIFAGKDHLGAEALHRFDLQRVGVDRRKHRQGTPTLLCSTGEALAEVAGRGRHEALPA